MTLGDLLNAPTQIEFEGVTYKLRQTQLMEEAEFQRWLEQRAFDAIERRTYQSGDKQEADRNALNRDCAAGVYEWGGEVCMKALATKMGMGKLLEIVLRDQGMTEKKARQLLDKKMREIAAIMIAKATDDPKVVGAALTMLGLPEDFLSSGSPTSPSAPESRPSGECPTSSSPDFIASTDTPTAPPG